MLLPGGDALRPVPWKRVDQLLKILRSDLPRSIQDSFYYVSMYCISEDTSNLRSALLKTRRIQWDTQGFEDAFEGLAEKLLPIVEECLSRHKLTVTFQTRLVKFWKTPDHPPLDDYTCPPDVCMKPLEPEFSTEIQKHWDHGFEGASLYIERLLASNFGLGIYLRSTGELIAWLLCNQFSGLGILHTKQDHRRKGYAQLMLKAMSGQLLRAEILPQGNVLDTNQPSLKLFRELGFDSSRKFFYIQAKVPSGSS